MTPGARSIIERLKRAGIPLTVENYRYQNYAGSPPEFISAEEQADIEDDLAEAIDELGAPHPLDQ